MPNTLNDVDAQILALERELAGGGEGEDDGSSDEEETRRKRKAAKIAHKEAKRAAKQLAKNEKLEVENPKAADCSTCNASAADCCSSSTCATATSGPNALLFSVHAGVTVHFSGRKPGEPKPPRGAKKRARDAAAAAAENPAATPAADWRC